METRDQETLLSIIITVLNTADGCRHLCETMPEQFCGKVEYVVVDDGCDAENAAILDGIALEFSWVRLIRNVGNRGVIVSQNTAAAHARGQYLCFRGADDWHLPAFWEIVQHHLPVCDAHLICGDVLKFRPQCEPVLEHSSWCDHGNCRTMSPEEFISTVQEQVIWGHTAILSRKAFDELGGMPMDLSWIGDLILTTTIAFRYGVTYFALPMVGVDVNRESFSSRGFSSSDQKKRVYSNLIRFMNGMPPEILSAYARSGWLGYFGQDLADVYLGCPDLWTAQNATLLHRNLYYHQLHLSSMSGCGADQRRINRALARLACMLPKEQGCRIGVYGTGKIGEKIAWAWSGHPLPDIHAYITTDSVSDRATFLGYPVQSIQQARPSEFDFLVIASKVFQQEIMANCITAGFQPSQILVLND